MQIAAQMSLHQSACCWRSYPSTSFDFHLNLSRTLPKHIRCLHAWCICVSVGYRYRYPHTTAFSYIYRPPADVRSLCSKGVPLLLLVDLRLTLFLVV